MNIVGNNGQSFDKKFKRKLLTSKSHKLLKYKITERTSKHYANFPANQQQKKIN